MKDAAARYLAANDIFVNDIALYPKKEKILMEQLTKIQTAGAELIVIADEELVHYTNSVNAYSAALLTVNSQSSVDQQLNKLAIIRANWMKQVRQSLQALKRPIEENLTIRSRVVKAHLP